MTEDVLETTPIKCGMCDEDITHLFDFYHRSDGRLVADGEGLHSEIDWFGDGIAHPTSDFPAPQPLVNHGNRFVRDGEILHQCGSWLKSKTEG